MSEGFSQRTPLATWNPARGVWETDRIDLFGHSELYSETWPSSGMTRGGVAYELRTPELRTDGSGCSSQHGLLGTPRTSSSNGVGQYEESQRGTRGRLEAQVDHLLKTPTAQLAVNGGSQHPDKRRAGGHGPTLADQVEHLLPTPAAGNFNDGETVESWQARKERELVKGRNGNGIGTPLAMAVQLLPTPRASDGEKGGPNQRGSSGDQMLPSAVHALLPTPCATDAKGARNATSGRKTDSQHHSGETLLDVFWERSED